MQSEDGIVPDVSHASLHLPARVIAIPQSLSNAAKSVMAAPTMVGLPYPTTNDVQAWSDYVQAMDASILAHMQNALSSVVADVEEIKVDGARIFCLTPHSPRVSERFVYFDIHGGALVMGGW